MSRDPAMSRFRPRPGVTGFNPTIAAADFHAQGVGRDLGGAVAGEDDGGDAPPPPPRSRLRRAAGALFTPALLIAGVVGGHWAWTAYAERRLGQYVDGLRRAGQPVLASEILPEAVPDDRNAALELCLAARAIIATDPSWRPYFLQGPPRLPMTGSQRDVVLRVLAVNRGALDHVTLAATKPGLNWAPVLHAEWSEDKPYYVLRGQGVYRLDALMNLLFAAALVAHAEGDEPAALARVDEMLFVARAVAARCTLNAYSYSLGREETALAAIGHILPDLRIGAGRGQVPPSRVAALAARLLDTRPYVEAMCRNARAERARQIESFLPPPDGDARDLGAADPWGGLPSSACLARSAKFVALNPARLTAEHQALNELERAIAALEPADPDHMLAAFTEQPVTGGSGHDGAFVRSVTASVHAVAHTHVRALARRRGTAVALACILYRAEHGAWPAPDLGTLVPRYLAEVPADPLAQGPPLIYVADPRRPRVYSVGVDGVDDGGTCYSALATDVPGPRQADLVIDLERQPLPPILQVSMLEEDEHEHEDEDEEKEEP